MRLRSVRNDLRGTDFAELMRLVGRYVDVHFAGDNRGVEFGHVCEVEAPPPAFAPRVRAPQASLVQGDVGLASAARPSAAPAPAHKPALSPSCAPRELDDLLRHLDAGFTQTLLRLIDERGFSDSQVYKRANISRQLFSKIRKDDSYRPTKQTALALGVALELELDELATLLERAGYALTHSSKADVIVEYFVTHGCYDVRIINEALYAFDQPLLGSNAA